MTTQYVNLDCSLDQWRKLVKEQYPTATIFKAPEDEGGTRSAFVDGQIVGDWDGSTAPYGRILPS